MLFCDHLILILIHFLTFTDPSPISFKLMSDNDVVNNNYILHRWLTQHKYRFRAQISSTSTIYEISSITTISNVILYDYIESHISMTISNLRLKSETIRNLILYDYLKSMTISNLILYDYLKTHPLRLSQNSSSMTISNLLLSKTSSSRTIWDIILYGYLKSSLLQLSLSQISSPILPWSLVSWDAIICHIITLVTESWSQQHLSRLVPSVFQTSSLAARGL